MTSLRALRAILFALVATFITAPAFAAVEFQQLTSKLGIRGWLVEDYSVPIITIRFAFEGGSTQDPAGKEGLTRLMTLLFDEGAGELDSEAFQIRLDDAGAEMGFDADLEAVYGAMRLLADQREEAFGLLKLAIERPRFDAEPIERMRSQVVTQIIAAAQEPQTAAQRMFLETIFGEHPYARRADGTEATLASITADDFRALHRAVFARANLHVGIVGAIDAETASAALDDIFGALPEQPDLQPVPEAAIALGQDLAVDYPLPQTSIFMAYPGVERSDPQYFAAHLMAEILGGTSAVSRLNEEVREKRGLTYGVGATLQNLERASVLMLGTATSADRAGETLAVIQEVIAEMAANGPTEAELASAKKYIIGSYALNELGSSSAIANTIVGLQLRDLGVDYISRRVELFEAVTVEDVKSVARKLLGARPTILQVGPKAATSP